MASVVFVRNPTLDAMAERVLGVLAGLGRGDILPLEAIEKAAGIRRYATHWSSVVGRVKKEMRLRRRIVLLSVFGVGYKLLTAEDQVNVPADLRQRRAGRQLWRAAQEIGCTPAEELSQHSLGVRGFRLRDIVRQRHGLVSSRRRLNAFRRSDTLPVPAANRAEA